ncbi:hypothetical protein D4R71_03180 [bacterium]|nr:MAG: hypothetical protein D4R71_03180 [bacterium]
MTRKRKRNHELHEITLKYNQEQKKIVILERSEESGKNIDLSSCEIISVFISFQSSPPAGGYAQTGMSHENTQKHTKKILPINMKSNKK